MWSFGSWAGQGTRVGFRVPVVVYSHGSFSGNDLLKHFL